MVFMCLFNFHSLALKIVILKKKKGKNIIFEIVSQFIYYMTMSATYPFGSEISNHPHKPRNKGSCNPVKPGNQEPYPSPSHPTQ